VACRSVGYDGGMDLQISLTYDVRVAESTEYDFAATQEPANNVDVGYSPGAVRRIPLALVNEYQAAQRALWLAHERITALLDEGS